MGAPIWTVSLVSPILQAFCVDHNLQLSDELAIEAARHLLALAKTGDELPTFLRSQIEDWYQRWSERAASKTEMSRDEAAIVS